MKKFTMLLICLSMFGIYVANAQQRTITGTVTSSEDNMGLPGVSVTVKGTTLGAATDIDGKYSLKVPQDAQILVFSSMGMQTQEITIGASNNISVVMEPSTVDVGEVMVVAYGTTKKSSFTGSATSVSSEKLEKIQTSDASKALEGAVTGVTISSESGSPGAGTKIRIRGVGSINASSAPLIIVDGSPYPAALNTINPADIASYNVLKDAASAALYGARGANGVILITTKSAKAGKTVVNFDAKVGVNTRGVSEYDIITDPATYYETFWQSIYHSYIFNPKFTGSDADARSYASYDLIADPAYDVYNLGYNIYDVPNHEVVLSNGKLNPKAKLKYKDADWNNWAKLLYKPQIRQEYNLSVSKATDNSKTFFSAGYLDDKGYNINTYFKRFTTRLKYSSDIYPWLKFENNIQYTNTDRDAISEGGNYSNTFSWTRFMPSIYPVYKRDIDGNIVTDPFTGDKVYDDGTVNYDVNGNLVNYSRAYGSNMNLVATQTEDTRNYISDVLNNNAGVTVYLPFDFEFSSNVTLSERWHKYTKYQTPILGDAKTFGGRSTKERESYGSINFNQILRWGKSFDNNLDLNVMLGHESFGSEYSKLYGTKTGFLDVENTELINGTKIEGLSSYKRLYRLEGYFGQATGAFQNKYYLSLSARRDASSVFHPDSRWGNFWSLGASWRISQEDFYMILKDWVPNMKLRASYGSQGNDYLYNPDGYRNYQPYQNQYSLQSDGTKISLLNTYMGNKDITWETNLNMNIGLEFSLKDNILNGEIDFFQRKTSDMLFNMPVPQSTGFTTKPMNIGNMKNTGVEVALGSTILNLDNFRWNVNVNMTHYKNEITKLPDEFKENGILRGGMKRLKEGGSIYDFYMLKWGGVDPETGTPLFMLKEKKDDKEYKALPYDSDKEVFSKQTLGTSLPDLQGGFSTDFEFFGFDLSAQFSYALGGLVYDAQYAKLMDPTNNDSNWHKDILDSWTKDNKSSSIPRLHLDARDFHTGSDRFLVDASYLAFKNATLGYTIPKDLVNKIKIQHMRVYFVVDNIALWSKRKGLDPRMSISGYNGSAAYSPIRTASFGINVKF